MVEVPRLENGDVLGSPKSSIPGRVRALNVALQAEVNAQQFYGKLAQRTPQGDLRDLFRDLAEMEDSHVAYLESKLTQDTAEKPIVQ